MLHIPAGSRVVGMQLPIQAQSNLFAADWEGAAGPADLARVAQVADASGYFYVGVCDHIAIPRGYAGAMGTWWQDCLTTLGWLAGQTTRTALLSHIYVLAFRHPLAAAKGFATLDHLSGGRALIGVGVGHVQAELEALGVPYEQRGRALDDALGPFIGALTDEYVGDLGARPRPVQSPRPPVWVGGEPFAVGHITPWIHVGEPAWDVGDGTVTGSPEQVADALVKDAPAAVNQFQVRFKARDVEELCDQVEGFGRDVAPLVTGRGAE
jgi:alkanesulfonate monooxygenase SsuD/methylene tetrahydromethanopterin reductase-like flavin-dependent oxidoreductase (luciferase family)